MTSFTAKKPCLDRDQRVRGAEERCPACGAVLSADSRTEPMPDWPAGKRFQHPPDLSRPDALAFVSGLLGTLSLVATVAGLVCLLLGPFTCFVTWGFAYYVFLVGLPVHIFALGTGVAGQWTDPGRDRDCTLAIINGLLGALLSCLVLAGMPDFCRGLPWSP
jgi:hypothetical protein